MVLALFLYFMFFVAEIENDPTDAEQDANVGIALYYYRFSTWKGKTIHLEFSSKDKMRGTGWATFVF
jgi:hypothetical protein